MIYRNNGQEFEQYDPISLMIAGETYQARLLVMKNGAVFAIAPSTSRLPQGLSPQERMSTEEKTDLMLLLTLQNNPRSWNIGKVTNTRTGQIILGECENLTPLEETKNLEAYITSLKLPQSAGFKSL